MFKNTFQSGFLSILYSLGSKPLQILDKEVVNGHIKRPQDEDIQSNAITRVKPYICTMPPKMDEGWNQIQLNLADLTKRAYGRDGT
ncbi:hypothetical protein L6164_002599 [Bauhinia variegata]|uniref:Uncharacterized protein n=1 Tax=Bauhinia variegata TaxID=167791 RepID=A0ACB9PY52_BAUVA|nr:hypothetical protein L6164_002599 [Bauhinia variegata]